MCLYNFLLVFCFRNL